MKLFSLLSLSLLPLVVVEAARGPVARALRAHHAPHATQLTRRWYGPSAPMPFPNITVKPPGRSDGSHKVIAPKIFIISLFAPEAAPWYETPLGLGAVNVTVPGLSPLFPDALCNKKLEVCQVITGEAEVNAAASVTALINSPFFDLRKTYFFEAGIGGINPDCGTQASAFFSRFVVQIDLQYEIDAREIPANFSTGYVPFGAKAPEQYPTTFYGTEVYELNVALRDRALAAARDVKLNDTEDAAAFRQLYPSAPANAPPKVQAGDVVSSDVYFSGALLGESVANYTKLLTNGTGAYCTTAEEDNAVSEAILRGTLAGRADFARLLVMRTASDFDRPPPGLTAAQSLFFVDQGGFPPSIVNIGLVGIAVVDDILANWESTYKGGIAAPNYLGNIFNSFNESDPDIGSPTSYLQRSVF